MIAAMVLGVERLRFGHMADRIVVRHVERIVGAHEDVVGAEHLHEIFELVRREHHRVEIDLLQVFGRRLGQLVGDVGARAPSVIDAARIAAEIAAAVHGEDLQVRVALQHAVEDQVVQRDRGIERVADHVGEIEPREALAAA